jgi:hypothetical protein
MLIITPKPKGAFCGLADHAAVLKAELEKLGELIQITQWSPGDPCTSHPCGEAILLEFTPLAYSRYGLSWPLLIQVVRWRFKSSRVITYFHELPFANGRQWKRRLAAALQQVYCTLLAGASTHVIVNQTTALRWLRFALGADRLSFLPTCSNVGETADTLPPQDRPLQVVVFGSPGKRRHAHALVAALGGYHHLFGVDAKVLDIGESLVLPKEVASEVTTLGPLPSDIIRQHLCSSRYGFFYSEPDQFSKSGVYAAYCANGVIPILAHACNKPSPFYLRAGNDLMSLMNDHVDVVRKSCIKWQQDYSAQSCARRILSI